MNLKVLFPAMISGMISLAAFSQEAVTLGECYKRAMAANALSEESLKYNSISELKDKNISKGWLPSIDAGAMVNYNSEVVNIGETLGSLPVPGLADAIRPLPHEQYRITVDINQTIWDGGSVKNARSLEKAESGVNLKQTETDMYKIRSQVNGFFFGILLAEKQLLLQENYLKVIGERLKSMESALRNGVILRSDADILFAEKLKLEQSARESAIRRASLLRILSDITGSALDTSTTLIEPSAAITSEGELSRPELELFDLRKEQLTASLRMTDSKRMPKAFAFATLGYGNPPGNNFFRDEFAPYYVIGAGIKWNIFDWNRAANERQVISYQQEIIEGRKKDLSDNLKRLLESKKAEITSLESMIETDTTLVTLRKKITQTALSQYENGTITAADYLNELNAEISAMLTREIHKINLSMAITDYLNISGKEIE